MAMGLAYSMLHEDQYQNLGLMHIFKLSSHHTFCSQPIVVVNRGGYGEGQRKMGQSKGWVF